MWPKLFAAPKEPSGNEKKKKKAKRVVLSSKKDKKKAPATPTAGVVAQLPVIPTSMPPAPQVAPGGNPFRLVYTTEQERMRAITAYLFNHPQSVHFREPVPLDFLDGQYHQMIKEPMDLATLLYNIDKGKYDGAGGSSLFAKNLNLIWSNAKSFNTEEAAAYQVRHPHYHSSLHNHTRVIV